MTTAEAFERELARRGWRFDPASEQFMDGERVLDWEDVIGLVPGLTFDSLRAWEEDRVDRYVARNQAKR